MKEIEIGCETWSYVIDGEYTHIADSDGEPAVVLRWKATEGEVRAAAYGYGAGKKTGKTAGRKEKAHEIKRALELV
jgi:hypothetical protein